MRRRYIFVGLVSALLSGSATAGPIFKRSPKPDPATQVPALLQILKSETEDERARARAAAALHEFDGKAFPDILPALIDVLGSDASATVRAEAADAIGRIRPITPQAGYALEQSLASEKSLQVKWQVRTALLAYRFLGYSGLKAELVQSREPSPVTTVASRGVPNSTVLYPTPAPEPFALTKAPPPPTKPVGPTPVRADETLEPPLAASTPIRVTKVPGALSPLRSTVGTAVTLLTVQPRIPVPYIVIPMPAKEGRVTIPHVTVPALVPIPTEATKPPPAKPIGEGPELGKPKWPGIRDATNSRHRTEIARRRAFVALLIQRSAIGALTLRMRASVSICQSCFLPSTINSTLA